MKYIASFGFIAIIVAAFAYYTIFSTPAFDKKAAPVEIAVEPTDTDSVVVAKAFSGTGSLESIRAKNEDVECTLQSPATAAAGSLEGTFFASEGKVRGDFLTPAPDLTSQILTSIIVVNEELYTWSEIEGELYGVKVALATEAAESSEASKEISLDSKVQYDCKPWLVVDQSVFIPPADVLFQDMSQLQQAGMEYGTVYEAETP